MAINTKFAQKSFTGLPNWAKGIIAVTLVSVTVYALYKLKKVVFGTEPNCPNRLVIAL